MNSLFAILRKLGEDVKYLNLFALVAGLLVFYPLVNYSFNSSFLWIVTFNQYNGSYYLIYLSYNIIFPNGFAVKPLLFTIILSATVLISIRGSQLLTGGFLKEFEETKDSGIIQRWRANKRLTSVLIILQYLALIALVGLAFLVWYNLLQQYTMLFFSLAKYALIVISILGVAYLINPLLDDEEILTQACLEIINTVREGDGEEGVERIGQVRFMLFILLNRTLSKGLKELEEYNLEPPLTTLYLALSVSDKEIFNKAKGITVNLLGAVKEQNVQKILKHLTEIDEQLGKTKKISEEMEVKLSFPSVFIYDFTPSKKVTRLKAIIPLIAEILLAILIFLGKGIFYTTLT